MEKDNKKKVTPDINEELMMNLMVDGVKKEGLQLPPETADEPEQKVSVREEQDQKGNRSRLRKYLFQKVGNQCP